MKISSDEITSVIKKQIENYKVDLNVDEVGTVLEVGDAYLWARKLHGRRTA